MRPDLDGFYRPGRDSGQTGSQNRVRVICPGKLVTKLVQGRKELVL